MEKKQFRFIEQLLLLPIKTYLFLFIVDILRREIVAIFKASLELPDQELQPVWGPSEILSCVATIAYKSANNNSNKVVWLSDNGS